MKRLITIIIALFFVSEGIFSQEKNALTIQVEASNEYILSGNNEDIYLQVKIKGQKLELNTARTPLNITMVIDKSGSMSGDKLEYVKKACNMVISNLTPIDNVGIVIYDTHVEVLQPSKKLENKEILKQKVSNLKSGSSTNLSGGMLEGFSQTKSTFENNHVNRVLLLSDGLANEGITDRGQLQDIVKSKYFNDGIALSTFGVGADFNEDMMTNLAEYGRGNYYFIDSPDNIPGIFEKELNGLLSVVAQNTKFSISFPNEMLNVEQVFGSEFVVDGNQLSLDFNDIFSEEEKLILIRFTKKKLVSADDLEFNYLLSYDDVQNDYKRKKNDSNVKITATDSPELYSTGFNADVIKTKIMFLANEQFELGAKLVDRTLYDEAHRIISEALLKMKNELAKNSIATDELLKGQIESQEKYLIKIKGIKDMPAEDRMMLQKAQKSSNYLYKKNKLRK